VSAFAGIVAFDAAVPNKQTENTVCRAVTALRPGRVAARRLDGALFAQRASAGVGGGGDRIPTSLASRDGRILFAASARLDNREELGAALGLTSPELARLADADLLLRMIEHHGDAGVARCLGAFAFALWDTHARCLTLGRDCLGNKPLFYHRGHGWVAFATTLGGLLTFPDVPREIDDVALAHFMALHTNEGPQTFYRGVERVPTRSLVTIDNAGMRHRCYWAPVLDAPPPYHRDEDYVARARELFDQAVAAATRDTPHIAIATSGGLDSSAIAATAARLGMAESITCFTMVPPPGTTVDVGPFRYFDERDKVAALARMHPQLSVRWIAPESLHPYELDYTRLFARAHLPIFGPVAHGWYAHLTDAVAAAGHRALLVGNYGNYGLTWRGNFALLGLIRTRAWSEFARELRATARSSGRSLGRTFVGDVVVPGAPSALRRLIYRMRGRNPDSVAHFSALNPAFIAEHALAQQWRRRGFDPWFGTDGWNPVQYRAAILFDLSQFARDLGGMAEEISGVEIRDPHRDRRLLEFVLSIPEPMFHRNGVPRAFARQVLSDRLPPEILNEQRRGAQVPDWFRRLQARRQDIAAEIERLEASPLASRLIDLPRLRRLMTQWPKDEHEAEQHLKAYRLVLSRGVHTGQFVRWVEGTNA
jgi:asparagine synthase (glutamine-hydrolysing)